MRLWRQRVSMKREEVSSLGMLTAEGEVRIVRGKRCACGRAIIQIVGEAERTKCYRCDPPRQIPVPNPVRELPKSKPNRKVRWVPSALVLSQGKQALTDRVVAAVATVFERSPEEIKSASGQRARPFAGMVKLILAKGCRYTSREIAAAFKCIDSNISTSVQDAEKRRAGDPIYDERLRSVLKALRLKDWRQPTP